jgi:hypothetical protein
LTEKGAPVIALNCKTTEMIQDGVEVKEVGAVRLLAYQEDGKQVKQGDLNDVIAARGLQVFRDGSLALRLTRYGGKIAFGSTTITSITRMQTFFLGRLGTDWKPRWAFHIHSDYSASFQDTIYLAAAPDGSLWFGGEVEQRFPDVGETLSADFEGGSYLFKFDVDGKIIWHALGSSITGHGKRFSNQAIRHVEVDSEGNVHLLGHILFEGTFAGKKFDKTGVFHFAFDASGEWKASGLLVGPTAAPLAGLVHTFRMTPDASRVLLWGTSHGLTFPFPGGGEISPKDPHFRGVWDVVEDKATWSKRTSVPEHVLAVSLESTVQAGSLNVEPAKDVMSATGQNVFVESVTLKGQQNWRAKSEGDAMLLPLQTALLKDGSSLLLIEWNERTDTAVPTTGEPTRYLLHLDKAGKVLSQVRFAGARFTLTPDEQIVFPLVLSAPASFETTSGKVDVAAGHLVVLTSNIKGQLVSVLRIPARGIELIRLLVGKDGAFTLVGSWNQQGTLGSHRGGSQIGTKNREGFVARISREGKAEWVTSFVVPGPTLTISEVVATSDGFVFMVGAIYPIEKESEVAFGSRTMTVDPQRSNQFFATFGSDGTLLSARKTDDSLCVSSQWQLVEADASSIFLAGVCPGRNSGSMYVARMGKAGSLSWKQSVGLGGLSEQKLQLDVDAKGKLYVFGQFSGTVTTGDLQSSGKGRRDLFVASFSPDGKPASLKAFGGEVDDVAAGMAIRGDSLVLTGMTRGSFKLGELDIKSNGGMMLFHANVPLASVQ